MSCFLHADVEILPNGTRDSLLFDRRTGSCFLLGVEERCLVELLQEGKSSAEVAEAFPAIMGKTVTPQRVREFAESLRRRRLLNDGESSGDDDAGLPSREARHPAGGSTHTPKLNFFFDVLTLFAGWLLHPVMILPALLLTMLAVNIVVRDWERMLSDLLGLFRGYPVWLYVLLFVAPRLLLLNLLHTLLAGMTWRQFGGRVRGFSLRLWEGLIPYFALDVGESFIFLDTRGRRTLISLGVWFPLASGAAATIGWAMAAPQSGIGTACLLFVIACAFRLLVQANIFFQYSSLYLWLCYATDHWRLLPAALDETRAWVTGSLAPRPLSDRERFWLRSLGVGYYLHRLVLILAMIFIGLYWIMPTYKLAGAVAVVSVLGWWNHDLLVNVNDHEQV